jgi:hypothetical protein
MKKFQIREGVDYGHGFTAATSSAEWSGHLISLVPTRLHIDVRNRLRSNLAHILSSLDIEAGLILPHAERGARSAVLFEPFYNTLILHFCIGTYSICEGLGAAFVLDAMGDAGQSRLAHVVAKSLRMLRKKVVSQPARLIFMEREPLDVSRRRTSSARRRRTAMLPGPLSFRLRAASSRNDTSNCQ